MSCIDHMNDDELEIDSFSFKCYQLFHSLILRRRKSPISATLVPSLLYQHIAQCGFCDMYRSFMQKGCDKEGNLVLKWDKSILLIQILYGRNYKSFIFLLLQTPFQRLTLRMTRFYTSQPSAKVWNRLQHIMRNMGYDARTSADKVGIQTKPWLL